MTIVGASLRGSTKRIRGCFSTFDLSGGFVMLSLSAPMPCASRLVTRRRKLTRAGVLRVYLASARSTGKNSSSTWSVLRTTRSGKREEAIEVEVARPRGARLASPFVKTCPECSEEVRDAARICRECGHLFPSDVPPLRARSRDPASRRAEPRRRAITFFTANPWRAVAIALLTLLVIGAVIGSGAGSSGDESGGREELAISLEGELSGKLDEVKQDIAPVLGEQGANGSAYRVDDGSMSRSP